MDMDVGNSEGDEDGESWLYRKRYKIRQPLRKSVLTMSSSLSRASPPPASPPSRKPQHQLPSSPPLRLSTPVIARVADSATTDLEAEKSKKILEWELSALEADDLRSHAWYHGQHVNRAEAERLLRQCVAEEHGLDSTSLRQHFEENNSDLDSDGLEDINSESSDTDFAFEDFLDDLVDERGMVPDPSMATSTTMAAALLLQQRRRMDGVLLTKRPKRPHRHRRHFYCFLVRDSLNVRPPGRYVVSCLRVDKYEDPEAGEKYKSLSFGSENERKRQKFIRRQRQRRQRRQQRHPVLHFVINEIILQPQTVYERSQFSFGETLPSMATAISTGGINNNAGLNGQQPGFDSVPDLIRYYVGGADDNAVLSYGCGNDGIVSGSMTLSRVPQTEVRIRYPCNRRRPLMTSNTLGEAVTPNILPVTIETSRMARQHGRALSAVSTCFDGGSTEASTSSQSTNRHRPPSPPPQPSKWMRVQSSSRSSFRRTPSATVTSAMVTSASSLKPDSTAESPNQFQSKHLALSLSPQSIDPRSLSTGATSASLRSSVTTLPRLARSPQDLTKMSSGHFTPEIASTSIQTLPRQSKSSPPLTPTSGSVSSSSAQRPLTSQTKSIWDQPSTSLGHTTITSNPATSSKITSNLTISELLASPLSIPPQPVHELPMQSEDSLFNYFMMSEDKQTDSKPGSRIDMDAEIAAALSSEERNRISNTSSARTADIFSSPYERVVRSSFIRVRVRNGYQSQYERNCAPFESQQDTPNSFRNMPISHNSRPESHLHMSDSPWSRSKSCWVRSESHIPKNSQNKDGFSENKTDTEQHQQQEPFSAVSSSISTSTLKNEVMKSNRQKIEHIVDQPQPDERHFTDKQQVYSYNVTHDERDLGCLVREVKDPSKNIEVKHQSLEKERALNNLVNIEVDQIVNDDQKIPEPHSSVKHLSSVPFENQNFQERRTRWTNTMRQGLVDKIDKPLLDHQNQQLTQISGTQNCDPRQRCLRQIDQAQNENHQMESIATELHKTIPDIETRQPMLSNSTNQATIMSPFVAHCVTHNSAINLSNNDLTENMIRQWVGLQGNSMRSTNSSVVEVYGGSMLPQIEMLPHNRRQQRQNNRLVFTSGDHQLPARVDLPSASEFIREHMTLTGDANLSLKKNINYPQVNQIMTSHSSTNQEGGIVTVTRDSKLSIIGSISDTNCPNTTTIPFSTDDQPSSNSIYGLEIGTGAADVCSIGYELSCDYVNINPLNNDHTNSFDKGSSQNNYNNHLDKIQNSNNQDQKKNQVSKPQTNDNYNNFVDNTAALVDYENITSHNNDDTNDFNYENIGQNSTKKQQQLNHNRNGISTAVAAALRAVHLAIIGDPDDSGGATTVGTGRLAASLCRADGRATVLPYPRNSTESEQVGPLMSMCPLQLLGQPGPEGRRARLDVIERFACLQYLVAMTVIVTPCLLLIGSDINDKENLADENLEWSLEDEYEYRRRRFYYRCAGISSCYVDGNVSTSDDEDENDESYKLTANSDFDSGYSLPPREEWAAEKRHWFDLLTRHRAAALDKWIRTAADAKQAVGDVYGYRALMSALCSDRIQALQHAWAALRRLHTATAVAFESRLRPEFLGRREKNLVAVVENLGMNDIDDNDVNELLQLPPNATIPDATALAVLYEHLYNDNNSDTGSISTNATCLDDIGSKKEKDPRLSSLFTSPLLLSPSPWLSINSGISGGLGSSVAPDYGLSALHVLCIQYSDWVQQTYNNDDSLFPLIKPPMLQLDRFRSNFRALLRQYSESGFDDYDDSNESCNYVLGFKKENKPKVDNSSSHQEINHNQNEDFGYEQQYEENVEEYGINGGDYDDCGEEDDDDATVICCGNSSTITTMRSNKVDTCSIATGEEQRQKTTQNEKCHSLQKDQEEDQYYRWIEDAGAYGQGPAPLNIVFRTELHVRLFWPPTLFLQDGKNGNQNIDHKLAIPAYALGTTYAAIAAATYDSNIKFTDHEQTELALNHVIIEQLNQAAQDMRLRYKAMDDFLDGACAYSMSVTKTAHEDNTMVGKQQQNCLLPQFE